MSKNKNTLNTENLLEIRGLKIEARIKGKWSGIVHGVDLDLKPGEVLGLIGASGVGKSTVGLAAMCFTKDGCRISCGTVQFDGQDVLALDDRARRKLRASRIAYVAQSAAAAFNPVHTLLHQYSESPLRFSLKNRDESEADARAFYEKIQLPNLNEIGLATRIKCRADSCTRNDRYGDVLPSFVDRIRRTDHCT